MISEGWELDLQHIVLPLAATMFFVMVVGAKLVYGDWGTAWNVGCFDSFLEIVFKVSRVDKLKSQNIFFREIRITGLMPKLARAQGI